MSKVRHGLHLKLVYNCFPLWTLFFQLFEPIRMINKTKRKTLSYQRYCSNRLQINRTKQDPKIMKCSSFTEAFSAWLPDYIPLPPNISVIRVDNKIDPHSDQWVWSIWLCMFVVGRQNYTDNAAFCRRSTSGATTRWNPRRRTIEIKKKPRSCGDPNKWLKHSFRFGPSRRYRSWWSQLSEAKRQISVNWTNLEHK